MDNNEKKIREILEEEEVPEQLSPENIKAVLDEKGAQKKRRSRISVAGRLTAAAAAFAVITGGYLGTVNYLERKDSKVVSGGGPYYDKFGNEIKFGNGESEKYATSTSEPDEEEKTGSYMNSAASYEVLYSMMKESNKKYQDNVRKHQGGILFGATNKDIAMEAVDDDYTTGAENGWDAAAPEESYNEAEGVGGDGERQHSDTYNQEEGVLEADIVKTDGEHIYMVCNDHYVDEDYAVCSDPVLRTASVEDGKFISSNETDISARSVTEGNGWRHECLVEDMYLYNGMLAVISTDSAWRDTYTIYGTYDHNEKYMYEASDYTFVSFYTAGDEPQLIGTYSQEGSYSDVRIAPDGYMYLITDYVTYDFSEIDGSQNIGKYIPSCGIDEDISCVAPEDILLPDNKLDSGSTMSYTIIGSIDMSTPDEFTAVDTKALAGYSGSVYCSSDNLYTTTGYSETEITRISIGGGMIEPAANGKVKGNILNQFSMSEYGGYFRIATTVDEWEENGSSARTFFDRLFGTEESRVASVSLVNRSNSLYVLDMDLNTVGSVGGFGQNESIKSVNFSGDMGYVVTYRQTDPLFAIDLSDPANPVITDEFKILGYSTYMQKWDDGLLLGFGADADEDGIETGVKLVMFDNSDPYALKEVGYYSINRNIDDYTWVSSQALWERKALLIAPEKNLIGIPITISNYGDHPYTENKFMLFSYDDGEFTFRGEFGSSLAGDEIYSVKKGEEADRLFTRALYIDDHIYILSPEYFVSADIETMTETDSLHFS